MGSWAAAAHTVSVQTIAAAGLEAMERLLTLLGRRAVAVTLPQGVGDVAELATHPQGHATFLRLLSQAARSAR